MSVERRLEEQALARLVVELREQAAPEVDWQRVEARLLREPPPPTPSPWLSYLRRLRVPAAGLLVAAAGTALFVVHRSEPARVLPSVQAAKQPLNGDQLALGTRVTSGDRPVVVEHSGRARWTLDPHATASVIQAGEFLTLRLDAGALSASVVPSPKPETFAVEVGGTRIAVHGTAFRVERTLDHVLVSVSEGTVAIEPVGSHATPSFLLRRGSRGSFALDGRTGSIEGNASALTSANGAESHREISTVSRPRVKRPNPTAQHAPVPMTSSAPAAAQFTPATPEPAALELPVQPSISDIETGVSAALDLMNRCFQDKTHSSGARVSVSTGLTVSVGGDGTVESVTFAPPLAPAVEDCAVLGLRSLKFARSREGVTFTRVFELLR